MPILASKSYQRTDKAIEDVQCHGVQTIVTKKLYDEAYLTFRQKLSVDVNLVEFFEGF